jgi:hypothetical protein
MCKTHPAPGYAEAVGDADEHVVRHRPPAASDDLRYVALSQPGHCREASLRDPVALEQPEDGGDVASRQRQPL